MFGLKKAWNLWLSGTTRLRSGDVLLVELAPAGNGPNSQNRIENNGQFIQRGITITKQGAPTALTAGVLLTAAQILGSGGGAIITSIPGTAANANYQLPTAANLDLALPAGMAIGDSFDFIVINASAVAAETCTFTTNTGWTLVGNMVVSSNNAATLQSQAVFRARKTAAGAYTLYRIG